MEFNALINEAFLILIETSHLPYCDTKFKLCITAIKPTYIFARNKTDQSAIANSIIRLYLHTINVWILVDRCKGMFSSLCLFKVDVRMNWNVLNHCNIDPAFASRCYRFGMPYLLSACLLDNYPFISYSN